MAQVSRILGGIRTGELSMLWRLFLLFLMWLFSALESRGLRSSKLQSNSPETDMTAPQLSNSPQYCQRSAMIFFPGSCAYKETYVWR